MQPLLKRVGIAVLAVFVLVSCGVTWYVLFRGPRTVQTTSPGSRDFPELTKEQAERVKARIEKRVVDRLAEEQKKWEASLFRKITEDEFVAAILP